MIWRCSNTHDLVTYAAKSLRSDIWDAFGISAHYAFGMVTTGILTQVRYRDQNTTTNPPRRQTFRGHKVVKPTLANREKLSGLFTANQQFVFRRDSDSLRRLLAITPEFCSCSLPLYLQSARLKLNDPICPHSSSPIQNFRALSKPSSSSNTAADCKSFNSANRALKDSTRNPYSTPCRASSARPSAEVKQQPVPA